MLLAAEGWRGNIWNLQHQGSTALTLPTANPDRGCTRLLALHPNHVWRGKDFSKVLMWFQAASWSATAESCTLFNQARAAGPSAWLMMLSSSTGASWAPHPSCQAALPKQTFTRGIFLISILFLGEDTGIIAFPCCFFFFFFWDPAPEEGGEHWSLGAFWKGRGGSNLKYRFC